MPHRLTGLLCGGLLLVSATGASAADAIKVHFRAEGAKKTLVERRAVTLADAPIVKDGDPAHACPGQTALGALEAGTHSDWTGAWSEGLGYYVTSIKGEKPKGSAYFELWVNHRLSQVGLCDAALQRGDDVLMFVQDCVYDPALQGCKDPVTPLGIRAPRHVRRGHVARLTVVSYTPAGKARRARGATVYANGHRLGRTNRRGRIAFKGLKRGRVEIRAARRGNARSEVDVLRVRPA